MDNTLLVIVLLLAANAYFVAAEFALVKAKSFRIDALAQEGNKMASLTQHIQAKIEPYLAACQLGITMASLGLGWVGEPAVAAILEPLLHNFALPEATIHSISFFVGFIIFSSLHIVVGEQMPKTFAIRKPEPVSMWLAYPLHWFYIISFPLNWLLNGATRWLLSLFGVAEASHADVLSGDELRGLIGTSEEHGHIHSDKATMLQNMFQFDTRTVEEIMVARGQVDTIDLEDDWTITRQLLSSTQHSRFPVISGSDSNLVGILITKDIYQLIMAGEVSPEAKLQSLCRKPLVVPETQRIGILFEQMRGERSHMAIVIDEYGAFAGIVTMEDLLEEIVGEIADEMDQESDRTVLQECDGYFQADGLSQITDIERALSFEFEDELQANTLSGLFMCRLGRVPVIGDEIEEHGYRFINSAMEGHRVATVTIEKIVSENTEDVKSISHSTTE